MSTDISPAAAHTDSGSYWRHRLDDDLAALSSHSDEWARLPIAAKSDLPRGRAPRPPAEAARGGRAACDAKGLDPHSPLAGEEWTSGPWALLFGINRLIETLGGVDESGTPRLRRGS